MKRLNRFFLVFSLLLVLIIFLGKFWMDWIDSLYFKHQGNFLFAGIDSKLVWLLAPSEFFLIYYYFKKKLLIDKVYLILGFLFPIFFSIFCIIPFLILFKSLDISNKPDPKDIFPFNVWIFAIHAWSWGGFNFFGMMLLSMIYSIKAFFRLNSWESFLALFALIFNFILVYFIAPGLPVWIVD